MTKKKNYLQRQNKRTSRLRRKIYRKSKKSVKSSLLKKFKGGDCSRKVLQVSHPLSQFIHKRLGDKYIIIFDKENCERIDYDNIYVKAFFNKIIEMLNFSFEKEREYHISRGTYQVGYKHNLNTVKYNLHNPIFNTYVLLTDELVPISYLYVEKNETDYDKVWTVCTDKNHREGGMASLLMNFMLVKQLNEKRNRMLLEVYNDREISRDNDDVKQKIIMSLFGKKGFVHTNKEQLEEHSRNNLLGKNDETKVMVFNPGEFLKNNPGEERNLNSLAVKNLHNYNQNNNLNEENNINQYDNSNEENNTNQTNNNKIKMGDGNLEMTITKL